MGTAIGLLLIIVCFLGTIFFRRYDGTVIPDPILWYIFFIVLGLLGVWLISISLRKAKRVMEQVVNTENEKFKSTAEKVELNVDKCEFKSGTFSHQVDDPNMRAVKVFAPASLASMDIQITETVIQSYLTYTEIINGTVFKFVSQSFPFDHTTLKFYVLNHDIVLYIDRFNPEKYLFDLKG
jgi:hypothetical protein